MGKSLYDIDNIHFVRPMYYQDVPDCHFVVHEFTQGETLKDLLDSGKLDDKDKEICLNDILSIFQALQKSDVVHRDITLRNLIYDKKHLKLIDFQLSVKKSNYQELEFLLQNPVLLKGLGTPEFRYKEYLWDDAYSLLKVVECIGRSESYGEKYDHIINIISQNIGKNYICYTNHVLYDKLTDDNNKFQILQNDINNQLLYITNDLDKKYKKIKSKNKKYFITLLKITICLFLINIISAIVF